MASPKSELDLYIIEKVKEKRKASKISQADLAFRLNLSYGFIGHVESINHVAKYNIEHLDKLAFIFKCSPKDFLPDKPFTKKID